MQGGNYPATAWLTESFDVVQGAASMQSIRSSSSEDSDMAQYSGRRRVRKRRDDKEKALQPLGFAVFGQCMHNPAPNPKAIFTDLVSKTKRILQKSKGEVNGGIQLPHEIEAMNEENIEIGEEEILRHDYDLERV